MRRRSGSSNPQRAGWQKPSLANRAHPVLPQRGYESLRIWVPALRANRAEGDPRQHKREQPHQWRIVSVLLDPRGSSSPGVQPHYPARPGPAMDRPGARTRGDANHACMPCSHWWWRCSARSATGGPRNVNMRAVRRDRSECSWSCSTAVAWLAVSATHL
jgi:hypothetical protein